jgi:hypothetical protein
MPMQFMQPRVVSNTCLLRTAQRNAYQCRAKRTLHRVKPPAELSAPRAQIEEGADLLSERTDTEERKLRGVSGKGTLRLRRYAPTAPPWTKRATGAVTGRAPADSVQPLKQISCLQLTHQVTTHGPLAEAQHMAAGVPNNRW